MTAATDLRLLSVQDYHCMVEAEVLAADEPVELIEEQLAFPNCEIVVREFLRSGEQKQCRNTQQLSASLNLFILLGDCIAKSAVPQ